MSIEFWNMWNTTNKSWCSRVRCESWCFLGWAHSPPVRPGDSLSGWWKPMQMLTCVVSHGREVMTCEIGEGVCIGRWLRFDAVSRLHTGGSLKPVTFDLGVSHTEILYLPNCRTWTKFTLELRLEAFIRSNKWLIPLSNVWARLCQAGNTSVAGRLWWFLMVRGPTHW